MLKMFSELSLIVVGILLALQIENWNEQRKEQDFTRETLLEIKNSLETDAKHLESRITRLRSIANNMELISANAIHKEAGTQELNQSFSYLSSFIALELKTGSYETLKNTGLNIVKNSELRYELVNLYDYMYPRIHWMLDKEYNHPNETDYWPVFNKYVTYARKTKEQESYVVDIQDFDKLLQDPEVIKSVRQKFNKSLSMIQRIERLQIFVDKLIILIEKELK